MSFEKIKADLIKAIKSEDITKVHKILQKNPGLLQNHSDSKQTGYKLLHDAIFLNNDKIVDLLVQFGVDVNFNCPLENVLIKGNVKCAEILLRNGAKLTDWEGDPPALHLWSSKDVPL